ncbi:MAG: prolyl oligopeptidase family serine peptidase [Actinomycetota bacterium]
MTDERPLWERRFRAPTILFPAWSRRAPDRAAVISDESGAYQAHAWDVASGGRRIASDEAVGVMYATVTADGDRVVWFRDATGDESGEWVAAPFAGGDAEPLLPGAPTGWPDGLALGRRFVAAVLADRSGFALYVSQDGGPAKELFRDVDAVSIGQHDYALEGFDLSGLSADESLLCITTAQEGDNIRRKLVVLDPATSSVVRELADPGLGVYAFAWSPVEGDQRLAIAHEREDLHRPGIWNVATGERTDLSIDLPGEVWPVEWYPDARSLLLVQRYRGRDHLHRYDVATGSLVEIAHPVGELFGAGVRPDGSVWLRVESGDRESRVLNDEGAEIVVPEGERAPGGRPYRSWTFTNPAGDTVHGFVITPPGEGPFPIFMKVHGGPSWLYCDTWMPEVQMLVDHGIAVGIVNYRGSTGYGQKWRDHIIRNIGFPEVEDTVAGLDELIARGIADPKRAIVGGWSWGGYVTLMSVGLHPDRWKAGVAGVPVGDYAKSYDGSAPSLQAYDRTLLGGVVHDIPEFVEKISPITYVDGVTCPVMFLIGENDTRCTPDQAFSYVEAFKAHGGDAEVYTYGTGHSSYVVDEEIAQWRAVLDFVLKHIG